MEDTVKLDSVTTQPGAAPLDWHARNAAPVKTADTADAPSESSALAV
jgi:hypothetical protein